MRLINRVLAAVLSLALIVVGVLVVVEVVAYRLNHRPALVHWRAGYSWAKRTPWNQGSVRAACIALIVVGLVLLVAELKRARVARLTTMPADAEDRFVSAEPIDTAYTRKGVAAAVRSAVSDIYGVRRTAVTVSRRKVTVAVSAATRDKAVSRELVEPVTAATRQRLSALQLKATPKVSVRVTPRSR